jgi:hypothetical protein
VRDSTVSSGDNRKVGLTFAIVQCSTLGVTPTPITGAAQPTIVEIGEGQYLALYDPEANGEAMLQLDAGSTLSNASDRYIDIPLTRDSSRIQSGINASGQVAVGSNADKTGYALATTEHASIAIDVQSGLSAQGYSTGRSAKLDNLDALVSSRSTYAGGNVTVGGYAPGEDPATLILASPANRIASDPSGAVFVNMAQPIPIANTAQTLGDALNAARAQGFGSWLIDPNSKTLKLFGPDGTTVVRTFMVDSLTVPMART